MGAKVCCHHEPDIDGIVPTPLNPEEDGLWKKLSEMKQWKAKMDNPEGPLRADLLKQGNYTALQDMSTDATKIGELIAKSEPLLAEALELWPPKRDWPNIKKTEAKFKFVYFEASEIWKKYVPTPDGGGSQVAPGPAQPAPAVPPQQPQGGPPNQPPVPIQPAAIQPQQTIQGEQNYVQPGAMGEGGPPRPPPAHVGGAPPFQPPAQPAYANPSYNNPAPNAYQAPPPQQQPNPYQANPVPTYQPSPQSQPPARPAPPPQSKPVQPSQPPPQQQPLVLPENMQKAARVFKMAGEMPARTELRKKHIEDQFEEMVAIMNNNLEAYNTAKNKRLSAPPPSPRKPPQRAAPPPAAPPHQPPPTQNVGAPQVGPPMGAPGGAPPRRPKPAPMSFQDQIAARSKQLNDANAVDHSSQMNLPTPNLTADPSVGTVLRTAMAQRNQLTKQTQNNLYADDEEVSD